MTYGAETVIPLETSFPTLRTSSFSLSDNNGLLEKSLDLIEEKRENAMVQLAYYQHKLEQGYNANVKLRPLEKFWVLQRIQHGESWGPIGRDHIASPW